MYATNGKTMKTKMRELEIKIVVISSSIEEEYRKKHRNYEPSSEYQHSNEVQTLPYSYSYEDCKQQQHTDNNQGILRSPESTFDLHYHLANPNEKQCS
jgi:D-ribose pyranose/furanose isomerase RbsD